MLRHSSRRGRRSRSNSNDNRDFGTGTGTGGARTTTSNNNNDGHDSDDDSSGGDAALAGAFARSQLVFRRAGDFWAVLGWAFRCAAEHPRRWRWWRVWLDFVVSVLEADLDERLALDKDKNHHEEGGVEESEGYDGGLAAGSLVVGYVEGLRRERRNALREVMRAVFAFSDAETAASDRKVFREVFEKETLVGVKSKRKRGEEAVVDLENDRFGDYLDGEDFEDEGDDSEYEQQEPAVPTPKGRRKPGRKAAAGKATADTFTLTDAIAETVPFRLRIFRLLSAVSYYLPSSSPLCPVDELYETFTDHVRGLPLPLFRLFIESHPATLPEYVQVSLLRMVVDALLPPSIPHRPDPEAVDPEHGAGHVTLTPAVMERCFLPYAAHRVTPEDNAKLSLALESMLWYLYAEIGVAYSEGLRRAVETGIRAREDRINRRRGGGAGGRKGGGAAGEYPGPGEAAREALARSARNLRALVDVIAVAGQ